MKITPITIFMLIILEFAHMHIYILGVYIAACCQDFCACWKYNNFFFDMVPRFIAVFDQAKVHIATLSVHISPIFQHFFTKLEPFSSIPSVCFSKKSFFWRHIQVAHCLGYLPKSEKVYVIEIYQKTPYDMQMIYLYE